jgi:hypothetical protein
MTRSPRPKEAPGGRGSVSDEEPPIFAAVRANDIELARQALAERPDTINHFNKRGQYAPLHMAVLRGNYSMVQFLALQPDADLFLKNADGRDPLELSLVVGHPDIKTLLFRKRAEAQGLLGGSDGVPHLTP